MLMERLTVAEASREALRQQCDRLKHSLYGPLFCLPLFFVSSQLEPVPCSRMCYVVELTCSMHRTKIPKLLSLWSVFYGSALPGLYTQNSKSCLETFFQIWFFFGTKYFITYIFVVVLLAWGGEQCLNFMIRFYLTSIWCQPFKNTRHVLLLVHNS